MRKIILLIAIALINFTGLSAQTSLPYTSGFDNAGQQAGWQAFRKGALTFGVWTYSTTSAFSAPNCLFHDYPVGASGTDTTVDWFVSPAFNFASGAKISLKVHLYSFSGAAWASDEFAMYLLSGNADPALATKTLLAPFTHMASSPPVWKDSNNIVIPATTGNSYIAFKYKTTNNWITPRVDNISIVANTTGVNESIKQDQLQIFPNPASNKIEIKTETGIAIQKIQLTDITGKQIREQTGNSTILNIQDVTTGEYLITIQTNKGIVTQKVIVKE